MRRSKSPMFGVLKFEVYAGSKYYTLECYCRLMTVGDWWTLASDRAPANLGVRSGRTATSPFKANLVVAFLGKQPKPLCSVCVIKYTPIAYILIYFAHPVHRGHVGTWNCTFTVVATSYELSEVLKKYWKMFAHISSANYSKTFHLRVDNGNQP